jgi:hypothetical protein
VPITAETLRAHKRGDVYIETGCEEGNSIQAALDAGFARVISIELDAVYVRRARERFAGRPVVLLEGDTLQRLPEVLAELRESATFWLDAHPYNSSPVIGELRFIEQHPIKTHTILIDDRRLMGRDFANVQEGWVYSALQRINAEYVICFADGFVPDDIIVAKVVE